MGIKSDNHGMSLLELVISMTISAIVILMIMSFTSTTLRVFRRTNDEVNLQMEAQTALNQIVNLMMESEKIDETDLSSEESRYQITIHLEGSSDYAIIYRRNDRKLYLVKLDPSENYITVTFSDKENLLAEYIKDFGITDDGVNHNRKTIMIKLQIGDDGEPFTVTKNVELRNAK